MTSYDSNLRLSTISLLKELELKKKTGKFWNISWKLGVFLSGIVAKEKPRNVLEIGTSNGFSTLWIIKGLKKNSKITTIEVNEERFLLAKENFKKINCHVEINQILGEFFEVIEDFDFKDKFDFIFLDAAHKKYRQVIEILEKKDLLDLKCTIVCDNVISHVYMGEFIEFMGKKYHIKIHKEGTGFLIASPYAI